MKYIIMIILTVFVMSCSSTVHNAALQGNVTEMKLLVKQGANINELDKIGCTPLHWAVYYRYVPLVKYLLEHGAKVDVQATDEWSGMLQGNTPLIVASYYGYYPIVELLLKHGADKNIKNKYGYNARMYANEFGHKAVLRILNKK